MSIPENYNFLRSPRTACACVSCRLVTSTRFRILQAARPAGKGVTDDMIEMWNEVVKQHKCEFPNQRTTTMEQHRFFERDGISYRETHFTVKWKGVTYRVTDGSYTGYSFWIDGRIVAHHPDLSEEVEDALYKATGYTLTQWKRFHNRMSNR